MGIGQPFARVDLNPMPESTVSSSQGHRIWPLNVKSAVQKQLQKGVVSFNQDILDNETSGSDISTDLVEALVGKTSLKTELPQAESIPTYIVALINRFASYCTRLPHTGTL
jgi:hypothetical protein